MALKGYGMSESNLAVYLREVNRYPLLTEDEEYSLAGRCRKGDEDARSKLITSNLRFVISVARKHEFNGGPPLEDLISAGNLGLMTAVDRFDETRGYKLISYAVWWIKQTIKSALYNDPRVIRLPTNLIDDSIHIHKVQNKFIGQYDREPTLEEIADIMKEEVSKIKHTISSSRNTASLDHDILGHDDGDPIPYKDVLPDEKSESPDSYLLNEAMREDVMNVVDSLGGRGAEVIRFYFGFNGEEPLTLEEIGERFNLTRERVRQIKEKALMRLRHPAKRKMLEIYNSQ